MLRHEHKSVDSYLSAISVDGTWVDEITVRAVGACIKRNIEILHDNGHITSLEFQELEVGATDVKINPAIKIGLIGELHYVSLVQPDVEKEVPEQNPGSASQCDWPSVWSEDVWHMKKERYKFLECRGGNWDAQPAEALSVCRHYLDQVALSLKNVLSVEFNTVVKVERSNSDR